MQTENETKARILQAALTCFLTTGIQKTTMEDVAAAAAVTRMTAYRYFGNKRALVRAAFLQIVAIFEQVQQKIEQAAEHDVELYVDEIEKGLSTLPGGDLPSSLAELKRVYPQIFTEFHEMRVTAVTRIFDRLFAVAEEQGILRPALNREIVQVYFMEAVVNLVENPQLVARNLSSAEVFRTVKSIFLYGILKEFASLRQ